MRSSGEVSEISLTSPREHPRVQITPAVSKSVGEEHSRNAGCRKEVSALSLAERRTRDEAVVHPLIDQNHARSDRKDRPAVIVHAHQNWHDIGASIVRHGPVGDLRESVSASEHRPTDAYKDSTSRSLPINGRVHDCPAILLQRFNLLQVDPLPRVRGTSQFPPRAAKISLRPVQRK